MKKFIMFLALVAMVSCSKDDDSNNVAEDDVAGAQLYLKSATVQYANGNPIEVEFEYNDDKELTDLYLGTSHYEITYKNGYVKIFKSSNTTLEFGYDNNNVLTTITTDGVEQAVAYDDEERSYTMGDVVYTVNEDNDLSVAAYEGQQGTFLGYDAEKRGAIFNYPTKNPFWIFTFISGPSIFSNKACTSYGTTEIENTFNDDGYLIKAVYRLGGVLQNTIIYTYEEL